MKKKHLDAEQTAEALLEALGKELGEARANFCEALMDPDQEDPPMFTDEGYWKFIDEYEVEDFESWKAARDGQAVSEPRADEEAEAKEAEFKPVATDKVRCGSGKRRRHLVLILVAVLILVLGVFAVAADGIKLKKCTLYMENDTGQSTRIVDIDKAEFDVEDFRVTYVPEGHELVEDEAFGDVSRMIKYEGENGDGIQIHIAKTEHFGANIDNETVNRNEVLINDKQAYLFVEKNKKILVWQMGDCTIDISARLSEEELIQIASHIFVD